MPASCVPAQEVLHGDGVEVAHGPPSTTSPTSISSQILLFQFFLLPPEDGEAFGEGPARAARRGACSCRLAAQGMVRLRPPDQSCPRDLARISPTTHCTQHCAPTISPPRTVNGAMVRFGPPDRSCPTDLARISPPRTAARISPPHTVARNSPPRTVAIISPPQTVTRNSPPRTVKAMVRSCPPDQSCPADPARISPPGTVPRAMVRLSPPDRSCPHGRGKKFTT
mmetsp:Transcript_71996/g.217781  ORF Transcript_71996/g.217781 Transcript_71996/m.217781 type:complete len:225 (+) Transcript_71996:182-856(+)